MPTPPKDDYSDLFEDWGPVEEPETPSPTSGQEFLDKFYGVKPDPWDEVIDVLPLQVASATKELMEMMMAQIYKQMPAQNTGQLWQQLQGGLTTSSGNSSQIPPGLSGLNSAQLNAMLTASLSTPSPTSRPPSSAGSPTASKPETTAKPAPWPKMTP